MNTIKIGAKVKNCNITLVQSKRKGGFFFLTQHYYFHYDNLISKFSFTSILSVHSKSYGHDIRYTL